MRFSLNITQKVGLQTLVNELTTMKSKVFVLNKLFEGLPKESDFSMSEENLPALKDGEFLAEAVYLSVDPYMRSFVKSSHVGKPYFGEQVAKILESKNDKYPVGEYVISNFGWRSHTIGKENKNPSKSPKLLPDFGDLPKSLALGTLGMPGNSAYFGLLDICKPEKGDMVVVTAAAGAVGSTAGQIAKIKGCHVVGIAGSEEKCQWITKELGFDSAVNYRDSQFKEKLAIAVPGGINCYFDNVGGEISSIVMNKMSKFGKVVVCGSISTYNSEELPKASEIQTPIKVLHLTVQGLNVYNYEHRWNEGIEQNKKWIQEGKLKYRETVTKGFENMPKAFIDMLQGKNIGKAIVEV